MRPRQGAHDGEARHPRQLRRVNMDRLLAAAMESPGPLTRADLVHATALSAPTVGNLCTDLVRLGLLTELGQAPSTGGRRPAMLEFHARHGFVVSLVVGAATTQMALADLRGEIVATREAATPRTGRPDEILGRMSEWIRGLLREAAVTRQQVLFVAAGLPGAVDRDRGTVVALMPIFEGWDKVAVGATLQQLLGVPVVVENDVNLAILGERWRGAARGHDTCAFISLGVGIGAGIVVGGELHRGHHSLAGEIALMCLGPDLVSRDFGSRGCLETLAGLDALVRRWRPKARGDLDALARALFQAARSGDANARRAISDTASLIGMATTHLSLVIDPSLVVFGGALVQHGEELLEETRRIVSRIIPSPPQLLASALGEKAALWGSVLLATEEARRRLRGAVRNPLQAASGWDEGGPGDRLRPDGARVQEGP